MKIGVVSDTHGSIASIQRAVAAAGPVDMWLHAGDGIQDARALADLAEVPVTVVAGNCDGGTSAKSEEFITAGGKTIWLTHGHRYRAKDRIAELVSQGRQYGVDIIVYGHSHRPDISWEGDMLVFNPGSTIHPRNGYDATCGVLVIENGHVRASILEVSG